jgi:hypothetical protein
LELTGFGNGQQASRGQLAGSTAIPKADFSPLHTGAQGSFGTVVGGLDTFLFEKSEQPLIMALMFDIPRWDVQYHAVPG